ncbi:sulfatase-like hydrolase/transferase [Carboxylicivirga marina]|uniref:Sulfatase-like hydrolase/transferase n=1 Tax=Carboxylicivirga marina TaxID=2800988 RepID=A0ABS1HKU5_9BACT|nr:sulfatase-like hydrolase/transferase [Carboxylicivirga marina]MBK3518225.1 sulfatase-like hydrolase/transferase [Carboxylicivirga marina]
MKKNFVIIFLAIFQLATTACNQHKKEESRPNIVFFVADDMTRDMFNFLPEGKGKNLTPNLDMLANEGVIMMGQHVSATVCTPSRFNVLTGKYASRATNPEFLKQVKKNDNQRVVEWNTHIMPGEANMASILQSEGYFTGATGKNHVYEVEAWKKVPLTADTSDYRVLEQQRNNYKLTQEAYLKNGFDYAEGLYYENPDFNGPMSIAVHNLDWSAEAAINFIEQTNDDPFFLYFATTLPHGPTAANRSWNADRHIIPTGRLDKVPDVLPKQSTIPTRLKKADLPVNNKTANILWMDDALGALIQSLKEQGKFDNTIIFFFNDHGQYAKGSVYQGATANPSVIWKSGGFKGGSVSDKLVSNVDFLPTIMDMVNASTDMKEMDGKSFLNELEGKKSNMHESMYFEIGYTRGVRKGKYKYIALRYPQWVKDITDEERVEILEAYNKKLAIRGKEPNNTDPTLPFGHVQIIPGGGDAEFPASQRYPSYAMADQLYDLEADPGEQNNLAGSEEYQKVLQEMQDELKKHIRNIPGNFGELKTD